MSSSVRRLLALGVLAALGGAGTAQAVAAKDRPARKAQRARVAARPARAVKLAGATAWPGALGAGRAPLTGTAGGGGAATVPPSAASAPGGPAATTPAATAPAGDPLPTAQQALGATVDERSGYTLRLSRTTLSAGSVVVQLINQGEDPHNLRIVRTSPSGATADVPETGPSQQTTRTLTLTAGTYYLFCTLTTPVSHEAAGMHATLRVDP